ncbi:MAG: fructosamine kinase family protein [Kofleriaceae bacterium]
MTASWQAELAAAVGAEIARVESVAGGDINDAFRVSFADRTRPSLFVKTRRSPQPGMFHAEAAGLDWLRPGPLRVPEVVAVTDGWLALEWLELGAAGQASEPLGRGLAGLHRLGQGPTSRPTRAALGTQCCGLDHDNMLATLDQDNAPTDDVAELWIERRLRPVCARAGLALDRELDALRHMRDRFGPSEAPARLHGDLWWGNVATCAGQPVVIDPAVYAGPREVDLAMLALFGSVPDHLIAAYNEVWPLEAGWRERVELWQLYPLAVHAVLFGGGYGERVRRTLRRLV